MAMKDGQPKAASKEQETRALTVRHLTNSLSQICLWIDGIVVALKTLPPETELHLPAKAVKLWTGNQTPLRTTKECPPPE